MNRHDTQELLMSRDRHTTDWIQCSNPMCGKWRPLMRAMDGQVRGLGTGVREHVAQGLVERTLNWGRSSPHVCTRLSRARSATRHTNPRYDHVHVTTATHA